MSKTVIIILSVLVLLLIGGVAIARYKGLCGGIEGRIGWMANRLDSQLELNDDQRGQLEILQSEIITIAESLRSDRESYINEAAKLLDAPVMDREQARTLLMQKQTQFTNLSNDLLEAFADFSDNLEPHQRDKLQAMLLKHHNRRHCGLGCKGSNVATQE
jgi:Spy/CpxP family protein refolding chaperone